MLSKVKGSRSINAEECSLAFKLAHLKHAIEVDERENAYMLIFFYNKRRDKILCIPLKR